MKRVSLDPLAARLLAALNDVLDYYCDVNTPFADRKEEKAVTAACDAIQAAKRGPVSYAVVYLAGEDYKIYNGFGPYRTEREATRVRNAVARDFKLSDAAPDKSIQVVALETYRKGA